MSTRGYAKHPYTQFAYSQGLSAGRIDGYPWQRRNVQGGPLYSTKFDLFRSIK